LAFVVSGRTVLAVDGDLDPTFGTDGKVLTDFDHSTDIANAVALQTDGKLVVVGTTYQDNDFSTISRKTSSQPLSVSHLLSATASRSSTLEWLRKMRAMNYPPGESAVLILSSAVLAPKRINRPPRHSAPA
jgi:hypothetical protein